MKKTKRITLRSIRKFFTHSPDADADLYILSYPKSGRTWLHALIGKYLSLRYKFPEDKMLSINSIKRQNNSQIIAFSHDGFALKNDSKYQHRSRDRMKYANKKVILLGRDIKDTLVSSYFQATKRENVFQGDLAEFIRDDRFGVRKILTFYEIWLQNRHVPQSILFIRYEDLHQNPKDTVRKVLDFIGETSIDENILESSVDFCSFENLRKFEKQNKFNTERLKAKDNADPESFKVRKGKVGGYIEYLSKEDEEFVDKTIANHDFSFSKFNEI